MGISQKCYYAIRAVHELARAGDGQALKIGTIAERQRIPLKFLEAILNQLRQAGFVESRRGNEGGYLLARPAERLSVGDIIRFIEGPLTPATCVEGHRGCGQSRAECVFWPIWKEAERALANVYDGVTFQDLVDRSRKEVASNFVI
ncbi:MAG: Rrf2 family transcriptional regulator [Deltaproteobacteria bacterium]|nr:Rrf2 family transcriptional regulator [Deltaproteobacteria bacterium]